MSKIDFLKLWSWQEAWPEPGLCSSGVCAIRDLLIVAYAMIHSRMIDSTVGLLIADEALQVLALRP